MDDMNENSKPQILVFGTGALGSVFGGFLQNQDCDVTFLGLGQHYEEVLKNGIKIEGIWGEHTLKSIRGFRTVQELVDNHLQFDIILVCVKSTDTHKIQSQLLTLLKENGIVCSIQNGLNNCETLALNLPKNQIVGGRIIFGVEISTPGTAKVTVYADKVLLGFYFSHLDEITPNSKANLQYLVEKLNSGQIPSALVSKEDIIANIWGKVLYNSALNPLGALLEVAYGDLGESEYTQVIIQNILKESFAVIEKQKIQTPYKNWKDYYDFLMSVQVPATKEHHSSMLQDINAGRITEIDALNGAIVSIGNKIGVECPTNQTITNLIKFKQNQRKNL